MSAPARQPVDVLLVSLGSTLGLRQADDHLADQLRDAGCTVEVARPSRLRAVRTIMLTDLLQALACRRAAKQALARCTPRAVLYSSTTAALLWPRPGAIRFDALAARTRPGRHGLWQRPLERQRLREAALLLPLAEASLDGAPAGPLASTLVLPLAVDAPVRHTPELDAELADLLRAASGEGERIVAVTYAADAVKKGLDRTLAAWELARRPGELLAVAGRDELPGGGPTPTGVVLLGRLERDLFRALVRAAGTLVIAPRREDYGMVQLEALAEGSRVVTTTADGPYAALPLLRVLWPEQIADPAAGAPALAASIRAALDATPDPIEPLRATAAVEPWSRRAVQARLEADVLPALLPAARPE